MKKKLILGMIILTTLNITGCNKTKSENNMQDSIEIMQDEKGKEISKKLGKGITVRKPDALDYERESFSEAIDEWDPTEELYFDALAYLKLVKSEPQAIYDDMEDMKKIMTTPNESRDKEYHKEVKRVLTEYEGELKRLTESRIPNYTELQSEFPYQVVAEHGNIEEGYTKVDLDSNNIGAYTKYSYKIQGELNLEKLENAIKDMEIFTGALLNEEDMELIIEKLNSIPSEYLDKNTDPLDMGHRFIGFRNSTKDEVANHNRQYSVSIGVSIIDGKRTGSLYANVYKWDPTKD